MKQPRQQRSRETVHRIINATMQLLDEKGFDELTVDCIVRRARSSKGAFYLRFRDKLGLLRYLGDIQLEKAMAQWSHLLDPAHWQDQPLDSVIRALVGRLVNHYREQRPLLRTLVFHARLARDDEFARRIDRLNRHLEMLLKEIVEGRDGEVAHPDPGEAAVFALRTVSAAARETILFGPDGAEPDGDSRLSEEWIRLFLAYLRNHAMRANPDSLK